MTNVHLDMTHLDRLDLAELKANWRDVVGSEPPNGLSRDLFIRGLSYELQLQAHGGLTRAERLELEAIATGSKANSSRPIKPGTRLLREWQGRTHEVMVTQDGYHWQGSTYRSLSQIARLITGIRWSGPRFFGVRV